MSDSFQVQVKGLPELLAKLEAVTREDVIKRSLHTGGILLSAWAAENRLTGPRPRYLGVKSNRLRSSVLQITAATPVEKNSNTYTQKIGTNVQYAPVHEFGLTINRISKKGKAFVVKYPPRPFLKPAIESTENQNKIIDILLKNINEALKK